jgi:hypothetical protein
MDLSDLPGSLGGDETVDPSRQWRDEVDRLLYEGETVEERVELEEGATLVVTSHRVLAFKPSLEGPNFEQVDRPNVEGVSTGALADSDLLSSALQWGVIGIVLIAGGFLVNLDSLVGEVNLDTSSAGQIGIGGFMGMMQGVMDLLALLDDGMRLFGALFLLLAVVFVGVYVWGRERTLVIRVAGDEDVHLPRPPDVTDLQERLEIALGLRPEPAQAPSTEPTSDDEATWSG